MIHAIASNPIPQSWGGTAQTEYKGIKFEVYPMSDHDYTDVYDPDNHYLWRVGVRFYLAGNWAVTTKSAYIPFEAIRRVTTIQKSVTWMQEHRPWKGQK